ncbi:MAG: hypothetical protein LBC18_14685 [Opitutaceae bacterium]|jgi:hypothetical protein|nr:hypothetical protein [Opitutaceae bacterium]
MAKKDLPSESTGSRRVGGASALLSSGRLGLYTENAFRILAMPVDATDTELQERHGVLKAHATLKRIKEVYTAAFGCEPPPSAHQLDAALERTNDGELRASDEFFWFWPREFGGEADAGLEAIAGGDAAEALRVWREWEQEDGPARAVARHNLAVNYLMLALEETAKHLAGTLAKTKETRLENTWKNAGRRWREVADDGHVWAETKKRILSKGDPALTAALADGMKADLGKTLSAIHGDIARHYAEKGLLERAKFHVDAMLDHAMNSGSEEFDDDYRGTVREVTKPVRDRLEAARAQAQSFAGSTDEGKKKQAFAKAKEFFETDFEQKAKPVLDLFYADDSVLKKERECIYDEAARTALNCCIAAFNARQNAGESTDDDTALLKKALAIATDPALRKKIEDNITGPGGGGLSGPAEVQAAIVSVVKDKDTVKASERFRRLQRVRPRLKEWAAKNSGKEECKTLLKMFAMLERVLSVEIFNKEDNRDLAITAIKCAIEDTPDADDRERFRKDLATLTPSPPPQQPPPNDVREILEVMAEVSNGKDKESPSARFRKLLGVRPKLKACVARDSRHKPLAKLFAMMERSLSIDITNEEAVARLKSRDIHEARTLLALALRAIDNAIEDTPDDDDRKKFRKDRGDLMEIVDKVGGVKTPPPPPPPRPPSHANPFARLAWTCLLGVSALILSSIFKHYLPAGWSVGKFIVQWHHLAMAGAVLGLVFPWGRLPYPLPPLLKAFTIWGIAGTAIVTAIVAAYTGPAFEALSPWLWRAAFTGFSISAIMIGPYWILTFVSQFSDGPTSPVENASLRRMPLFFLGVTFLLFSFGREHIPLLAGLPMLRWWHFPVAGVALGLFVPVRTHRSYFYLQSFFMVMWPVTLAAWLAIIAYNAIAPETSAVGKWWAPYAATALTYLILVFRLERLPVSFARMEKRVKP